MCALTTKIFAIRKVQVAGILISIASIALCGVATEHWHVVLLFGIVTGMQTTVFNPCTYNVQGYSWPKLSILLLNSLYLVDEKTPFTPLFIEQFCREF